MRKAVIVLLFPAVVFLWVLGWVLLVLGGRQAMRDFCLECAVLSKACCRVCWGAAWYFATHLEVFSEDFSIAR